MPSLEDARNAAIKVLGEKAKVPEIPATISKATENCYKAYMAFNTSVTACEGALLTLENANSAVQNAMRQFLASIEKSDFDLDAKTDAKKIKQGQKILTDELNSALKLWVQGVKTLDEVDKHMIQLGKYKPEKQ